MRAVAGGLLPTAFYAREPALSAVEGNLLSPAWRGRPRPRLLTLILIVWRGHSCPRLFALPRTTWGQPPRDRRLVFHVEHFVLSMLYVQ